MSPKDQLILDILDENRLGLYPFDIVARSNGQLGRATIVVALNALVEQGFVSARKDEAPSPPALARTRYFLSENGRRARMDAAAGNLALGGAPA